MTEGFIDIPMDVYESSDEIVILMPLGGVEKSSLEVNLENTTISVKGERKQPQFKDGLMPLQQECFWGKFNKSIDLPQNVYFDKIHTKLLSNNILMILIPKIIIPNKVKLDIEML